MGFTPFGIHLTDPTARLQGCVEQFQKARKVNFLVGKTETIIHHASGLKGSENPYIYVTRQGGDTNIVGRIFDKGIGRVSLWSMEQEDGFLPPEIYLGIQTPNGPEKVFDTNGVGDLTLSEMRVGLRSLDQHVRWALSNQMAVGNLGSQG